MLPAAFKQSTPQSHAEVICLHRDHPHCTASGCLSFTCADMAAVLASATALTGESWPEREHGAGSSRSTWPQSLRISATHCHRAAFATSPQEAEQPPCMAAAPTDHRPFMMLLMAAINISWTGSPPDSLAARHSCTVCTPAHSVRTVLSAQPQPWQTKATAPKPLPLTADLLNAAATWPGCGATPAGHFAPASTGLRAAGEPRQPPP